VGFKSNAGRCRSSAFFVCGSLAGVNSAHDPQTKNAALRAAFDLAEGIAVVTSNGKSFFLVPVILFCKSIVSLLDNTGAMTILYADDDNDDRDLFAEILSALAPDLKLITSKDGAGVISALEATDSLPQVIVLDMNMPLMTGLDCLIELKRRTRFAGIPVVIFSTSGPRETVGTALENGADEYYLKANSYEALETFISNLIMRYNLSA